MSRAVWQPRTDCGAPRRKVIAGAQKALANFAAPIGAIYGYVRGIAHAVRTRDLTQGFLALIARAQRS